MNDALTVRAPRPEDAEEWVRIHLASWRWSYAHLFPPEFFDQREAVAEHRVQTWREVFEAWGQTGEGTLDGDLSRGRVAERDGQILGIGASCVPGREDAHPGPELELLYVDPQHTRTGAGTALLQDLLGEGPAHLWAFEDNPRARPFYARHGFRPEGARKQVLGHAAVLLVRD